jgi:hypothetical protein
MNNTHVKALQALDACSEAIEFARGFESIDEAWQACERGDWMLWLIGKTIGCAPWTKGRKPLLACTLDCAETAAHLRPAQASTIDASVAVLRAWIEGKATTKEAREAREGLIAAASSTYALASGAAASINPVAVAAYAFCVASTAAGYGVLRQCADIVRKHFPHAPAVDSAIEEMYSNNADEVFKEWREAHPGER